MAGYGTRLDKLEKAMAAAKPSERWHRIIQRIGESVDEAIADYEEEHGPIGKGEYKLIRRIVAADPERFNGL